jgi:GT2 family glycosyltransferase
MNSLKYSITFACYNQVTYTRQCIESMIKHGLDLSRVVVVDNDSSDETREYLSTLPLGGRILNKSNMGCGVAWNQGALALQSEWTIIMNNDVLVSRGWVENLINVTG